MARTKEDFLLDARTRSTKRRLKVDAFDPYSGNENIGNNLWGTNETNDGSIEISEGNADERERSGYGIIGSEQDEDRGRYGYEGSSNGEFDTNGFVDIPIRNYHNGSYQSSESVQRSPVRAVKKKRTSLIDNAAHKIGNMLPQKTKDKVKIAATTRKLLTLGEVATNRKSLIDLVIWSSDHLDDGIIAVTKHHRPVEIWSNLEYADAEILVDAFLEMGQKSEKWAHAVRTVIDYQKRLKVGVILAPRIYKSIIYIVTTGIDIRMY